MVIFCDTENGKAPFLTRLALYKREFFGFHLGINLSFLPMGLFGGFLGHSGPFLGHFWSFLGQFGPL